MKNYKIEIKQSETYIFDAEAENVGEASAVALIIFREAEKLGTLHYNSTTGEAETIVTNVYDVTGTDDAPQE